MSDDQLDMFVCHVDESAGLADEVPDEPPPRTQLTELPGETFEDLFGDAA